MNVAIRPTDPYDVEGWNAFYAANPGWHRSVGPEGDNGGGDGGDGGDGGGDGGEPDIKVQISEAVDLAVKGLKSTNAELKAEKKALSDKLNTVAGSIEKLGGDEGIERLLTMKANLEKDEVGKLLAEGKHDEWFDTRTSAMRKDHDNQVSKMQEQLDAAVGTNDGLRAQLRNTILRAEVLSAAKDAGVLADAAPDIQLRAERAFTFDEERQELVIKDDEGGVLFGKDGKTPKGVAEWLDEQKDSARHWWPPSQGGGAGGSGDPAGTGKQDLSTVPFKDFKKERMEQKKAKRAY